MAKMASGKTVLITGGEGRLGRALTHRLAEKGFKVKVLIRSREKAHMLQQGVVPYVGDICSEREVRQACSGADAVYHLAAVVSQYKASGAEIHRVNVEGTTNVVEACGNEGIKRLIFSSSIDVYGIRRHGVLNENALPMPTDVYGRSKYNAENIIRHSGIDHTIFRIASIYGKGFEESFFKLFKLIRDGRAYIIGSGKNRMALIHVSDVVSALALASVKKHRSSVYNLGDGKVYTQEGLMDLAAGLLGVERPGRHISEFIAKVFAKKRGMNTDELRFLTSDRAIDISLVKRELGFRPVVRINEGGRELVGMFMRMDKPPERR